MPTPDKADLIEQMLSAERVRKSSSPSDPPQGETPVKDDLRYCICADPENCTERIEGYICRRTVPLGGETPRLAEIRQREQRVIQELRELAQKARGYHVRRVMLQAADLVASLQGRLQALHASHQALIAQWRRVEEMRLTSEGLAAEQARHDCADELDALTPSTTAGETP
jgi:hypothetical protein